MTAWTSEELARIGTAEEVQIASLRDDDALAVGSWPVGAGGRRLGGQQLAGS